MSLYNTVKSKVENLLSFFKRKREKYSWSTSSNNPKSGFGILKAFRNGNISYRNYNMEDKSDKKDEKEVRICTTSDGYKKYIAEYYKKRGYTVWEYNKYKKEVANDRIDIVLKKSKDILLVECRNCNDNIDLKQIEYFKLQADIFLKNNQVFDGYNIKLRYAISSLLLEEEAYRYMKKHRNEIDYEIIKEIN